MSPVSEKTKKQRRPRESSFTFCTLDRGAWAPSSLCVVLCVCIRIHHHTATTHVTTTGCPDTSRASFCLSYKACSPSQLERSAAFFSVKTSFSPPITSLPLPFLSRQHLPLRCANMGDDGRYPSEDEEDGEGGLGRRASEGSAFSFEHVEICPLEAQCNPALDGKFDKAWLR